MRKQSTLLEHVSPSVTRELHLIDVENLIGGTNFIAETVGALHRRYAEVTEPAPGAQVVLGASATTSALESSLGWPGSRLVWKPGKDGAELALLEVVQSENVAARFGRVVIGSGDHEFAPVTRWLRNHGVEVVVVANRRSLSRSLGSVASRVLFLDTPIPTQPDIRLRAA